MHMYEHGGIKKVKDERESDKRLYSDDKAWVAADRQYAARVIALHWHAGWPHWPVRSRRNSTERACHALVTLQMMDNMRRE